MKSDHEEAKRIVEKHRGFTTQHGPLCAIPEATEIVFAAYLALLTEHSARDADIYLLVSWVRARLISRLPSPLSEAADRLHAQLALPATESKEDLCHPACLCPENGIAENCPQHGPFWAAWKNRASLPATEPAQPEEEPNG